MGGFILKRLWVMLLAALCLTLIVFFLANLTPNLEKLARSQSNSRMTDAEVEIWLDRHGYSRNLLMRYGEWLGIMPGWNGEEGGGRQAGRCLRSAPPDDEIPRFCGVMQGDFGYSTVFKSEVGGIVGKRLLLTGKLMFWVMIVMVPTALVMGVLAGMREGSRTDRTLSTLAVTTTAMPEYVSGVILIAVFSSSAVGLKWLKGSAASAMDDIRFDNFTLPVLTMALYGMGYIARMTRASMAEVMTAQYIRTARLKGLSFTEVVLRHALRNALIAPFTVIMLQFPWLLTGVVVVETLFNYKGFGWTLVQAASNNDIDLLLACSVIAVIIVLLTQFLSDAGYAVLNPRLRAG